MIKKIGKVFAAVVLSGCLIGSLGINVVQYQNSQVQNQKVNRFISDQLAKQAEESKKENTYEEDGFKVGEQYEIRSTKAISDAYISGDESKLSSEDKKTLKMAKAVIKKVIKNNMTVYEKEEAIYNWMYKNIDQGSGSVVTMPNSSSAVYTPAGVLSGRKAVCVGYATTFRMFMQMLGLECHVVHNEYHSWDLVQLDDGEWYYTDIYSDVSTKSQYMNFNMTEDMARMEHEWDSSCLPEAKGTKYSYALQHCKKVNTLYDIPTLMKKSLDKKAACVSYDIKTLSKKDMKAADVLVNQINRAMDASGSYENQNVRAYWINKTEDTYVLCMYIRRYSNQEESGEKVDSKVTNKITKKVNDIFGTALSADDWNSYEEY